MRHVFALSGWLPILLLAASSPLFGADGSSGSDASSIIRAQNPNTPYQAQTTGGYYLSEAVLGNPSQQPVYYGTAAPAVNYPVNYQTVPTDRTVSTTAPAVPFQVQPNGINRQAVVVNNGYQTAPVQGYYAQNAVPELKPAPVQVQPAQAAPVQAAPVQAAPVQAAPVQAEPIMEYADEGFMMSGGCGLRGCGCGFGMGAFSSCQDPCRQGLLSPEMKRMGQFYVDGWASAGGSTNNRWPITTTAGTVGGGTVNDGTSDFQLNQLYAIVGREVNRGGSWDLGGRVDVLYGSDYLLASSLGLESYNTNKQGRPVSRVYNATPHWNINEKGGYPEYGVAMPQAYAEVYAPFAAGTSIKLGHFYSPMGYESLAAPSNFFYSHSYTMLYGEPQTVTGALADVRLSDSWSVVGGFHQGWDVWEDNNDQLDFMGGFKWQSFDRQTALSIMAMTGKAIYDNAAIPGSVNNFRTLNAQQTNYSVVFERRLNPLLTWVIQHDLGIAKDGGYRLMPNGNEYEDAHWYSVVNYLYYQLSPKLSLGFRAEWFQDENYSRLGLPISNQVITRDSNKWDGDNFVDLSLGLNWKPTTWLTVRPEVRWDWSDMELQSLDGQRVIRKGVFNDFTDKDMVTVGGDVVARF